MKVGVIGVGVVGLAVLEGLQMRGLDVVGYDKFKTEFSDLSAVLETDVVFVCVPTLTKDGGEQDLDPLESTFSTLKAAKYAGVVCVKSTVLPGVTRRVAMHTGLRYAHNPEFLTAAKPLEDFLCQDAVLVSGPGAEIVSEVYKAAGFPHVLVYPDTATTEMAKYMHNLFLATKVSFFNEMFEACGLVGTSFADARAAALAIGSIGEGHTVVPGPDGRRGYGGMCLVAGSRISTANGFLPIETLRIGDIVQGREACTTVTQLGSRFVTETVQIRARGRVLRGSADHIHFKESSGGLVEETLANIKVGDWIPVARPLKIENYEICVGAKPNNRIQFWQESVCWSDELAYAVGLWLADGCVTPSDHGLHWSLGLAKEPARDRLMTCLETLGCAPRFRYSETEGTYGLSRVYTVRVRQAWLYSLLEVLGTGRGARGKRCPKVPAEFVPAFLGGWLDGDGSSYDGTVSGYSESREMIAGLDGLFLTAGICPGIAKDGRELRISTRDAVAEVCSWTTRLRVADDRYANDHAYASPNLREESYGWLARVSEVKTCPGERVYSLETADHTYVANTLLTHNCFPKDTKAFLHFAKSNQLVMDVLEGTVIGNARRRPHE